MKTVNQSDRISKPREQCGKHASFLLAFMVLIAQAGTVFGGIVPANCLIDWTPGVSAGVPGGIPTYRTSLINVTQAPYNADKTGVQDASSAIQSAINAATSNQVVYLPAGTYLIKTTLYIGYSNKGITLRGAGTTNTILNFQNSASISVGTSADYGWNYPTTGNQVSAGLTKGSTTLTMADTSAFSVGGMIQISMANDTNVPVIDVMGYDLYPYYQCDRKQKTRVIAKTATTLNIFPPLYDDYSRVTNLVFSAGLQSDYDGIENLFMEMSNSTAGAAVQFEQCYACWLLNVRIHLSANYHVSIWDSLNCEMRGCFLDTINHGGSNGSGLLHNSSSADLIEDNIMVNAFPGMEINHGSCGNVFAYNFLQNTNGLACIDSNHGPHNCFNLYEGNVIQSYECDGYFGSDSQDTIYRNWINGQYGYGDGVMNHIAWTIALKRFTRSNSIVGNILGTPGAAMSNDGISLGQPNMGNSFSSGFGPPWAITWIRGPGTLR